MNDLGRIMRLIRKDLQLEYRDSASFFGIVLFTFTTVFIVYKSFREISVPLWNALFWIVLLFVVINLVIKSFRNENHTQNLYYRMTVSPGNIIVAKLIYNSLNLFGFAMLLWGLMSFFSFNPVLNSLQFVSLLFLASIGLASVFTFVSVLGSADANNATMISILGMPLVLPIILLSIKICASSIGLLSSSTLNTDFSLLIGIDLLLIGASIILFPILWKA